MMVMFMKIESLGLMDNKNYARIYNFSLLISIGKCGSFEPLVALYNISHARFLSSVGKLKVSFLV